MPLECGLRHKSPGDTGHVVRRLFSFGLPCTRHVPRQSAQLLRVNLYSVGLGAINHLHLYSRDERLEAQTEMTAHFS